MATWGCPCNKLPVLCVTNTIMLAAPYSFAAVNAAFVYTYCTCYQKVEVEEYGGTIELLKDGFMTSFALFLVSLDPIHTPLVSCVLTLKSEMFSCFR